jgi:hypothetical protein
MSDSDILTATGGPAGEPSACARSGTFCVRPWQHMRLDAGGEARVCCAYTDGPVEQDGIPVSTDRQSLMQIWNADTMRNLRRDMVDGRHVPGCRPCYEEEARGGVSTRIRDNAAWQQGWLNEQRATIDEMMRLAVDHDFRLPKLPAMIEVEVGNLCNLRCRTCNSFSSSRIANDPVQRKWDGIQYSPHAVPRVEIDPGKLRRADPIETLVDELATDTGSEVNRLYFVGGEPFLVREIPRLLERLVAVGRAHQISLLFVSNGSIVPEWLSLAAEFRRVDLAVSVDGYANDFDYIRFPGRWSKIAHNLQLFKKIPNVGLQVTTTVQVNNALGLTRLFRYLDSVEIGFTGYLLRWPPFLAVSALPASIRRLAAGRLTDYAESDCRPEHRALIGSFASQFDTGDESVDVDVLRDLMLFTNDLDRSRGQSIRRTDPELVALLEQAGFPWQDDTLHASADRAIPGTTRPNLAPADVHSTNLQLQRDLAATARLLREELVRARDRLAMADTQADLHEERAGQLAAELTRVRLELDLAEPQLARARLELARVCASRSWWVTGPLRSAERMLGRWLPGKGSPGNPDAG